MKAVRLLLIGGVIILLMGVVLAQESESAPAVEVDASLMFSDESAVFHVNEYIVANTLTGIPAHEDETWLIIVGEVENLLTRRICKTANFIYVWVDGERYMMSREGVRLIDEIEFDTDGNCIDGGERGVMFTVFAIPDVDFDVLEIGVFTGKTP